MDTEWCIGTLARIVSDLSTYDGRLDVLDACSTQLELVYRELVAMDIFGGLSSHAGMEKVQEALSIVRCMVEAGENDEVTGYSAPVIHPTRGGRPVLNIPRNQLAYLLESRFTVPQIADILQVSIMTIRRRMSQYQLSVHSYYTSLTDDDLDAIVCSIQHEFPTCGNRQMQGHLFTRGIRVQQRRVRESQRRVDPCGSMMRRLRAINRRQYRVNGPGALWHIDGNHKMIRYRTVP